MEHAVNLGILRHVFCDDVEQASMKFSIRIVHLPIENPVESLILQTALEDHLPGSASCSACS